MSTIGDIEAFLYSGDEGWHYGHRADIYWGPEMFALAERYHADWPEGVDRSTPLDAEESAYLARAVGRYGPKCLCGRCVDRREREVRRSAAESE